MPLEEPADFRAEDAELFEELLDFAGLDDDRLEVDDPLDFFEVEDVLFESELLEFPVADEDGCDPLAPFDGVARLEVVLPLALPDGFVAADFFVEAPDDFPAADVFFEPDFTVDDLAPADFVVLFLVALDDSDPEVDRADFPCLLDPDPFPPAFFFCVVLAIAFLLIALEF